MSARLTIVVLACLISVSALALADNAKRVDVPAGNLIEGLESLARQCGVDVIYPSNELKGLKTRGVSGTLEPKEAFRKLIEGTPLILKEQGSAVLISLPSASTHALSGNASDTAGSDGPSQEGKKSSSGDFRVAQVDQGQTSSPSSVEKRDEQASKMKSVHLEEVLVTGTHIHGAAPIGSPIMTFDDSDFQRAGAVTADQFLATLPQNFGGGQTQLNLHNLNNIANPSLGSAANLLGLGSSSTLVLINGHRSAAAGQAEYTDISMIPLGAVDHIEVLADGASAIYGSDAIGGVINFIMKRNYDGAETDLRYGETTHGDGREYFANQLFGRPWATGSVVANYEYYEQGSISSADRSFSRNGNPFSGFIDLLPRQKRHSLYVDLEETPVSGVNLYGNFGFSHRGGDFDDIDLAYGPGALIHETSRNEQYGATLGGRIALSPSWQLEASGGANINTNHFTTDDVVPALVGVRSARYAVYSGDAKVDGPLFELPGGSVKAAVGSAYRHESYRFTEASLGSDSSRNVTSGFAELLIPVIGGTKASPSAPRLEFDLAARYEQYTQFGSTLNPKYSVRALPTESVVVRGSYGTSFKAPTLFQASSFGDTNLLITLPDPLSAAGHTRTVLQVGNNPDLTPEKAHIWTTGVDFIPISLQGTRLGLTYYNVRYVERIGSTNVSPVAILINPIYSGLLTRRGSIPAVQFDNLIEQLLSGHVPILLCPTPVDPVTGACPESPGDFGAIIDRRLLNIAGTRTSGLDLTLSQHFKTNSGDFDITANVSRVLAFGQAITSQAGFNSILNTYGNPVAWRGRGTLAWAGTAWTLNTSINVTGRYSNEGVVDAFTGMALPPAMIGSWVTIDAGCGYNVGGATAANRLSGVTLSLYIRNILDRKPPYVDDGFLGLGFDPSSADPTGRFVALTLATKW